MATFNTNKLSWLTDPRSLLDGRNGHRHSDTAEASDDPRNPIEDAQFLAAMTSLPDRTTRPSIFSEHGGLLTSAEHQGGSSTRRIGTSLDSRNDDPDEQILKILKRYLSPITAKSILLSACRRCNTTPENINHLQFSGVIELLKGSLEIYLTDIKLQRAGRDMDALAKANSVRIEDIRPVTVDINSEDDIERARQEAMTMSMCIQLVSADRTAAVTVVSELARNIFRYAMPGKIELRAISEPKSGDGIEIIARDEGPGIRHLDEVLSGTYKSDVGLGKGLLGCMRIIPSLEIKTSARVGTTITARFFPRIRFRR